MLQTLRGGLRLPETATSCAHVMYGYDCSVTEAILHMTSNPPLTMVCYVVGAGIDANQHTVGPYTQITKWLKRATRRMLSNLCEGQIVLLGGAEKPRSWISRCATAIIPIVRLQAPTPCGQRTFASQTGVARVGGGQVLERYCIASVPGFCQEPQ